MSSDPDLSFLIVEIAGQLVACDVRAVHAVLPPDDVVAVPLAPSPVAGITTKRGHVLTVIDGRAAVTAQTPPASNSVVIDIHGYRYALLVDAVDEVVTASAADIAPPPPGLEPAWACFTTGMIRLAGERIALVVRLEHFVELSVKGLPAFNHPITTAAVEAHALH